MNQAAINRKKGSYCENIGKIKPDPKLQEISAHICSWEKQLVFDDRYYAKINQHYQQVQKLQFNEAIQRGLNNSKKFTFKPGDVDLSKDQT